MRLASLSAGLTFAFRLGAERGAGRERVVRPWLFREQLNRNGNRRSDNHARTKQDVVTLGASLFTQQRVLD